MKIANAKILEAVDKAIKKVINEEVNGFGSHGIRANLNVGEYYWFARYGHEYNLFSFEKVTPTDVVSNVDFGGDCILRSGKRISIYDECLWVTDSLNKELLYDIKPGYLVFQFDDLTYIICNKDDIAVTSDGIDNLNEKISFSAFGKKDKIADWLERGLAKFKKSDLPGAKELIEKVRNGIKFEDLVISI